MLERLHSRRVTSLSVAAVAGTVLLLPDDPRLMALTGFVGLVLWCEATERARAISTWHVSLCGLVFGSFANATALFSLIELFGSFARMPWPLALLVALLVWLVQGLVFSLAATLSSYAEDRGSPRWLSLPLALMVSLGFFPTVFPWHVAATQVGFSPFVQLADLSGETLVGLFLAWGACSLHALLRAAPAARVRLIAMAAFALLAPCAYGLVRLPQIERLRAAADTLSVGVAQSNVSMEQKHDEASKRQNLEGLRSLTTSLEARGVDLTVWGETAYPYPLLRSAARAPEDVRRVLREDVHGPILLGLETYEGFGPDTQLYNTAWLVRRDGSLGERVDKARLLPFGEYTPWWDYLPEFRSRFASKGFTHGVPGTVTIGPRATDRERASTRTKLGVLICYEDLFASSARATVALGARALLNLTNDAWFGRSREPLLHDLLARLRSIELRRDLVRAVNTGVSSFTSATGQVLLQTKTFERASFVATVRLLDEQTLYARVGDWSLPLCLLALSGCLARRRSVTGRQRSEPSAD